MPMAKKADKFFATQRYILKFLNHCISKGWFGPSGGKTSEERFEAISEVIYNTERELLIVMRDGKEYIVTVKEL